MKRKQRQFVSGRVHVEDERDRKYRLAIPKAHRLKRTWDASALTLDQGWEPICVGCAWLHWLASAPIKQGVGLDPRGIYRYAQMEDEWDGDYEGTSVRGAAKVLANFGVIDQYRWSWKADHIAAFVLETAPVVFGSDWYSGMDEPNAAGLMSLDGAYLGGHAYLLCGYNTRTEMFRVKNSYGEEWGMFSVCWTTARRRVVESKSLRGNKPCDR